MTNGHVQQFSRSMLGAVQQSLRTLHCTDKSANEHDIVCAVTAEAWDIWCMFVEEPLGSLPISIPGGRLRIFGAIPYVLPISGIGFACTHIRKS